MIKYNEPPEARIPKKRWRLYPFKGSEALKVLLGFMCGQLYVSLTESYMLNGYCVSHFDKTISKVVHQICGNGASDGLGKMCMKSCCHCHILVLQKAP